MKVRAIGYGCSGVGEDLITGQHMSATAYAVSTGFPPNCDLAYRSAIAVLEWHFGHP